MVHVDDLFKNMRKGVNSVLQIQVSLLSILRVPLLDSLCEDAYVMIVYDCMISYTSGVLLG